MNTNNIYDPNNSNQNVQNTIKIDPFVSSNMDDDGNSFDVPVIEKVIDVDTHEVSGKKMIIYAVVAFVVLSVMGGSFLFMFHSPNKKSTIIQNRESDEVLSFSSVFEKSIKEGNIDKEIKTILENKEISVDKVYFMFIDLDYDEDYELLAYASDEKGHYLLKFDVEDEFSFSDFFQISGKDCFALVYFVEKNDAYWCFANQGNYTILQDRKLVIKEEDFVKNYFVATLMYKNQTLIDNMIEYSFDKKIDVSKIEQLTKDSLLKDNQMTLEDIKSKADVYFQEKGEKEQKAQEEMLKAQELEEQKQEIFDINGVLLHYGTYIEEGSSSYGDLLLNRNNTCLIDEEECTWSFVTYDFGTGEQKAILIKYNENDIYISSWGSSRLSDKKKWNLIYKG